MPEAIAAKNLCTFDFTLKDDIYHYKISDIFIIIM